MLPSPVEKAAALKCARGRSTPGTRGESGICLTRHPRRSRMAGIAIVALAFAALIPPTAAAGQASKSLQAGYHAGRYIVTFADAPAVEYDGSVRGYTATRPRAGHKIDGTSVAVQRWQQHLTSQHDAALAKVGATK